MDSLEQGQQVDRKRCFTSTESRSLARSLRGCARDPSHTKRTHTPATKLLPTLLDPRAWGDLQEDQISLLEMVVCPNVAGLQAVQNCPCCGRYWCRSFEPPSFSG